MEPSRKPLDSLLPFKLRDLTIEEIIPFLEKKWKLLSDDSLVFKIKKLEPKVKKERVVKIKVEKVKKKIKPSKEPTISQSFLSSLNEEL